VNVPDLWQDLLLHELLERGLEANPDATLGCFEPAGPPISVGLRAVREQAGRIGAALQASGLEPGDRVLVMMDNSVELVGVLFGISLAGGVSVPVNTATRGSSLRHILNQVGARWEFVDHPLEAALDEVSSDGTALRITTAPDARGRGLDVFAAASQALKDPGRSPGDAACILYTSGSTGPPKGVICTHGMMAAWAHNANEVMAYQPADRVFIALPIFHANALCCALLPGIAQGANLLVSTRFSAAAFWSDVRRTEATAVNLLGTMEAILRTREITDADRDHQLNRTLVIPAPANQAEFAATFGVPATTLYGLTDSGIALGVPAGSAWPDGSCGRPIGGWSTAIVNEYDVPVAPGETGYLVVRPELPGIMMLGYLDNAEATTDAWRNLWFHTADRMTVDADGWYYFAGRASDSIRRGGENISAFEVELVLNAHPAVTQSAVVGVASAIYGQEAMAFLQGPTTDDLADVVAHCARNLPYFAVPRYVELVETLPRTTSEKVDKPRLAARGIGPATIDRGEIRKPR
jgi:crotonobetaine/carnitine-CoA ligase